jgi:type II secretory ATPase GspE/PulE/Tfp pilus assembly ATPase PilB-like protein
MSLTRSPHTESVTKVQALESEVSFRKSLQEIGNRIYTAADLDEILIHLKDDITGLFSAQRITIYIVDGRKKELISRHKTGNEIKEIRVPISPRSIAGYAACKQKLLNIRSAYDAEELSRIDPALRFDHTWDEKTGFKTRQVLAYPVVYQRFLLGAIQLINRRDGKAFTEADEQCVKELAPVLAAALYTQKRMAATRSTKFGYLVDQNILTSREFGRAASESRRKKVALETILIEDFNVPKHELGKALSRYYGVPFVTFEPERGVPEKLLQGTKVSFMRRNHWVPLGEGEDSVDIAIDNPGDLQKVDMIRSLFRGRDLNVRVALPDDISAMIHHCTRSVKPPSDINEIISQLKDEIEDVEEEIETGSGEEDSTVVQLVNKMILDACSRNASDIHIEPYPGKQNIKVRFRVDGVCHAYQSLPYPYGNAVVSRIKIMSDLDIAERRKPQDGKIRFKKFGGKEVELRVTTVPTQGGLEDVVLRILKTDKPLPLEEMHFSERNQAHFLKAIQKPHGIVFVCGPTGSGKTTTLHSALARINTPERKIWTAEDPVEITQAGLRQMQVKPKIGLDFSKALRAFLRADPDVIMIGEMRDQETARMAIQASLTGHLVFSTLHTNSAPESITRLLDMEMDPFNFADAIVCILAQRLVMTLCPDCKRPFHPPEDVYAELVREYGQEAFAKQLATSYDPDFMLYSARGCRKCGQTGYRGRMAIHELLMGTDAIKHLVQSHATVESIRAQAVTDGMTTLKQDGIAKVFGGYTDLLQVRKVTIR